jgi:hypothetical protein
MNVPQTIESPPVASGSRWGLWSWLMLPMVVVSFALTFVLSVVLLGMSDLEGSEPMSEQGVIGWVVVVLGAIIAPLPNYLGLWFGIKGTRLGEGMSTTIAAVLNGLVAFGLLALIVGSTLGQM